MNGLDIEMPDGTARSARTQGVLLVTGGLDIHCLFRLIGRLLTRMQSSRLMTRVP